MQGSRVDKSKSISHGLHRMPKWGKALGRLCAVRFRAWKQKYLYRLGASIHRKTHVFFLPLLLGLGVLLAGFKAFENNLQFNLLWIESGGRLETEMRYSAAALGEMESNAHLLVTQTAKKATSLEAPQQRLLHKKALLAHLHVLKVATRVTVNLFDVSWTFKDICLAASPPEFESHYIDSIFETMMPCQIITPLDCFWEGSKLLGPENPVTIPNVGNNTKWTNLNPLNVSRQMKIMPPESTNNFPFDMLENYMKRAGITSGYQEKLCLDPEDPECPETAPNKKSKRIPDIGAELTNGCRGFSTKFMHWPKNLIMGGISHNKTGYVNKVEAFQSVVQLMGEKELYDFWAHSYKVMHFMWDQEKAALVLKSWQRKFIDELNKAVKNNSTMAPYDFTTVSTTLINESLDHFNILNPKLIYIGFFILFIYVCVIHLNYTDAVRSQLTICLCSLLLIFLAIASGIAFCVLIGIQFHTATINLVTTVAITLGSHNLLFLMFSYKRVSSHEFDHTTRKYIGQMGQKQVGMTLRSAGTILLMENLITVSIFMTGSVAPIPALRALCLQCAVLAIFILFTSFFGLVALISFDVRRKRSSRIDILCCFPTENRKWLFFRKNNSSETANTIDSQMRQLTGKSDSPSPTSSNALPKEFRDTGSDSEDGPIVENKHCCDWTSTNYAQKYVNYLTTGACSIRVVLLFVLVIGVSVWGITRIQVGLPLSEMAPIGSNEQKFFEMYGRLFGFYNMYAVTQKDFEYPTNQKLLYEYHDAFMRVPNILKNDNGGLPQMWLSLFREWLIGLQKAFDKDWERKCITQEGWESCATENGILGYKLLVQTGNNDNPIDKSLVLTARLVSDNGIINEETFYNLLTAWASNDILAYGASQANIRPEPRRWMHVANDYDLQIVKSSPIIYAQMPYYANNLYETSTITKFITTVRGVCKSFDERGLPNYPSGIPFVYWEQYQDLFQYTAVAIAFILLFLFLICCLFLCNIRSALITVFMTVVLIIQTLGFMGFINIKFSAISVVLLFSSISFGILPVVRLCLSFVTSIGDKRRRIYLSLDHMSKLILQSGLTVIIAASFQFFQNTYISRTFFLITVANTVCALINSFVFLPVFLFMFGPSPELQPLKYADRISTPSPEPIKKRTRYTSVRKSIPPLSSNRTPHHHQQNHHRHHHQQQQGSSNSSSRSHQLQYAPRDGSLSTIAEESGSYHSASLTNLERTKSQVSLSRSPSPSIQSDYSTDSGSEISTSRAQSVNSVTTAPTRCVVTAKFELELDGNVMSAAAQPCVHKSSSKHHHKNRQSKKYKRHHNTRY